MSKNSKLLVGLIALIAVAEGWFISMTYNLDNRLVPLNRFRFSDRVEGMTDNYVSAAGSWMSDTELANPIQSSVITCLRDSMVCVDSRGALVDNQYLLVDTTLFDVEIWNEREIVTKPDEAACTKLVMRLDRVQKQVTATRTTEKKQGCLIELDERPIHLYLGDGLDASRKVRYRR